MPNIEIQALNATDALEFNYAPDNVEKCIRETEVQLRDLITSILTRDYGTRWEDIPTIGFPKKKRETLEKRREDRKKEFPNQIIPMRLVDYTYILDLRDLITKNESLFRPLFPRWDENQALFGILGNIRDYLGHIDEIPTNQKYLALGICGEFLQAIETWKKGYSRRIKLISCNLEWGESNNSNDVEAQKRVLALAQKWLDGITAIATGAITRVHIQGRGDAEIIPMTEGVLRATIPRLSPQAIAAADVYIETENMSAFDRVVRENNHSYWTLEWTLSDSLDVNSLITKISELTGKIPTSRSGTGTGKNTMWTDATYTILNDEGFTTAANISGDGQHLGKINLVNYDASANGGFRRAHEIFSPDLILSILFGEKRIPEVRELVRAACKVEDATQA